MCEEERVKKTGEHLEAYSPPAIRQLRKGPQEPVERMLKESEPMATAPLATPQQSTFLRTPRKDTLPIFEDVGAKATVPVEMEEEKGYSVRITLTGEKSTARIEKGAGYYEESATIEADPTRTLTIKAHAEAFKVEPKEIEARVPPRGKSSEHDFLVTPLRDTQGRQKLLFQILQGPVHLATLNADIDVTVNPRLGFSHIGAKFRVLSRGLREEYESGVIPLVLHQHLTGELVQRLNSKDYEETRYLLILLIASQPPYRNHGNPVKGELDTYAFTRTYLREVAGEALRPLPSLEFEFYKGARRVLEERLDKALGFVRSYRDDANLIWYYLTRRGLDEVLSGLENLLMTYCAQ